MQQLATLQALPGRTAALIRRNPLFAVALAAGAAVRAVAVIGYPGPIWFPGDSYLYLGATLRPRPDLSKSTGYSFFLRALEPFHSLILVIVVQNLMGLALAVMIYALLRRARLPRWGAALATLPVLLDGFEIQLEHMVMAETVFTFCTAAAVTLLLWRSRPGWLAVLLAGLLLGYVVTVRSEGLPLLVLFPLYLLVRWRGWRAFTSVVVGCALPVLAYLAWFHSANGQYTLTRADGFYLFGRVSSFAECSKIKPPPDEQRLCYSIPPSKRQAPGQLIWVTPNAEKMPGGPVSVANDKLLRDYAIRAVEAQPLGYLGVIGNGLKLAVQPQRIPYPGTYTYNHYKFPYIPQHVPANHAWIPGGTAAHDVRAYGGPTQTPVVRPFSSLMRLYQRLVYTYGPLFGAIMVVALAGLVRRWRRLGGPGLLPAATAVVLLVFPIATADFDYRYLLPVLPFACLAAGLAFAPASLISGAPVNSGGSTEDDTAPGSAGAGPQERAGVA